MQWAYKRIKNGLVEEIKLKIFDNLSVVALLVVKKNVKRRPIKAKLIFFKKMAFGPNFKIMVTKKQKCHKYG